MMYMIIDGIKCEFENARNVLEVALHNGIEIPNLCYCEILSTFGGCRLCVVENERGGIEAACTMIPRDGMSIRTNTAKLREYRRGILELLLESHNTECATCAKSGKCKLQEYAKRYGVTNVKAGDYCPQPVDDSSHSIVLDPSKCILCGKCVRMCNEIQDVQALDFMNRGNDTFVSGGIDTKLADTNCVGCGQCAAVCPTGAITLKNDIAKVWSAIHDSGKKVAVQIAPAVRFGLIEEFGMAATQPVMGKIVTALKLMGVDYVFDSSLCAYQTVIEEAEEFAAKRGKGTFFSSYCPGWVKHIETEYPKLVPQLATAGSPMEICGALIREKFADEDVVSVAILSCSAAKIEAQRKELVKNGKQLVDVVLTTQELIKMIREYGMTFTALPDTPTDNFFAQVVGKDCKTPISLKIDPEKCIGCTKCAKRCPVGAITGTIKQPHSIDMDKCIRCRTCMLSCAKGAIYQAPSEAGLKVAVANGLARADDLIEKMLHGEAEYDFVEVMACPSGCFGGGGQPEGCIFMKPERHNGSFELDYQIPEQRTDLIDVKDLVKGREKELFHVR